MASKNILKTVQFNTFTRGNSASGLSASPAMMTQLVKGAWKKMNQPHISYVIVRP
jgi:hypothetical protein